MKMNFIFNLLVCALPTTAAAAPPFTLQGKVLDPAQAPIAAARVSAVPASGGAGGATRSDARGEYHLILEAGEYVIEVAAEGFLPASEEVRGRAGERASRLFVLALGRVQESVTVSAPGYEVAFTSAATKTTTALLDVPQSVTVATREQIKDQLMMSIGDVVRYVPGVGAPQGENNRDQVLIRGNSSSADFFLNGVRDDVQYYRDLYNLDRVEALKGPNAMIFGRGGGGGVINRVTKEAGFTPLREITVQGGGYAHKRVAADVDQPLTDRMAFRVNGMYEDSGSFRSGVGLERYALNPTLTYAPSSRTRLVVGYEYLRDARVADRGIPSFQGRPAAGFASTFFGDPDQSRVRARVSLASAGFEHRRGNLTLRNRVLLGDYDRGYQNFVPGAVAADQSRVSLSAYNNATRRQNAFNQTDVIYTASTGALRHTLMGGLEVGRQVTDNFRNTGYFDDTATAISVPYADPTIRAQVTFRQSATDADNRVRTHVAATYLQDQLEVSRALHVVAGLRLDRFDLRYRNHRNGDVLSRTDDLVSPRLGVVLKPAGTVSLYGSYSVSHLPSSGDQFSSLTTLTQQVEPERFTGYELGAKWDARPDLRLTLAAYRLDRTNTRATDPQDPTRIVQTGRQRTDGCEIGINGRLTAAWQVAGGYSYQDARVTSATVAARLGAVVGQVPRHTFALWNNYRVASWMGLGLGVLHRTDMYAAIDNTVVLPGYTRLDGAAYFVLGPALRLQANVENLFDTAYYVNADSNTNITPGYRRALRVGLTATF
jgi:catecholate siderophore receptor